MYGSLATAALTRIPVGVWCTSDQARSWRQGQHPLPSPECRKSSSNQSGPVPAPTQAPWLSFKYETSYDSAADLEFEERIKTIKRSAIAQKNAEEKKQFGAIDYDSRVVKEEETIGLGAKIGVGVAIAVFGLFFAFGDFLPSRRYFQP